MFPTGKQLSLGMRSKKIRRNRAAAFEGAPMRKGVVSKIVIMSPRKPNSARRAVARITILATNYKIFSKIPGIGAHHLQPHSVVMVRSAGPKDTPGVNYNLIRGLYDFNRDESFSRANRRSKFGVKKQAKQ